MGTPTHNLCGTHKSLISPDHHAHHHEMDKDNPTATFDDVYYAWDPQDRRRHCALSFTLAPLARSRQRATSTIGFGHGDVLVSRRGSVPHVRAVVPRRFAISKRTRRVYIPNLPLRNTLGHSRDHVLESGPKHSSCKIRSAKALFLTQAPPEKGVSNGGSAARVLSTPATNKASAAPRPWPVTVMVSVEGHCSRSGKFLLSCRYDADTAITVTLISFIFNVIMSTDTQFRGAVVRTSCRDRCHYVGNSHVCFMDP